LINLGITPQDSKDLILTSFDSKEVWSSSEGTGKANLKLGVKFLS
jgi:hypothetical protein